VGNVLQLATTVPTTSGGTLSENQSFCYDEQDRLVWAGNSGSQHLPGNGTCGSGTLTVAYSLMDALLPR